MPASLVRDLMPVGVPSCKLSTPIMEIARFLLQQPMEEMVVLGTESEGVGIVECEELVSAYARDMPRLFWLRM